jgi:F-box interacting protein
LVTLSIPGLLQKNITIVNRIPFPLDPLKYFLYRGQIVSSCNGLLFFIGYSDARHSECLCFWNPAMRTNYKRFGLFINRFRRLKYSFGYDNSAGTYKVVAFYTQVKHGCNPESVVKAFNLGDNSWRDIQCFPVLPLYWFRGNKNNGVYLSGTINWLALRNYFRPRYGFGWFKGVTVEQYVIVSLDLSTESYTEILLPRGFDEVPHFQPTIAVLMNCLCFGHDFGKKHFVIWHMKDFGVQESWVQLFKISYHNLYSISSGYLFDFQPLYLSENGHTLIFTEYEMGSVFVYNCIDDRIERIRITNKLWLFWVTDYIESLVSTG